MLCTSSLVVQFSMTDSLVRFADSSNIISHPIRFVNTFFEISFKFFSTRFWVIIVFLKATLKLYHHPLILSIVFSNFFPFLYFAQSIAFLPYCNCTNQQTVQKKSAPFDAFFLHIILLLLFLTGYDHCNRRNYRNYSNRTYRNNNSYRQAIIFVFYSGI